MNLVKISESSYGLRGDITIYTVRELNEQWQTLAINDICVDLSKASKIDESGIQLLLFWKIKYFKAGKNLQYTGHTAELTEALCLLGLVGRFGDKITLSSSDFKSINQNYGLRREPLL